MNRENAKWLVVPRHRLIELIPTFAVLQKVTLLRCRWADDESVTAYNHHFDDFKVFFGSDYWSVLMHMSTEANIALSLRTTVAQLSLTEQREYADVLWYTIDWIRLVHFRSCDKHNF